MHLAHLIRLGGLVSILVLAGCNLVGLARLTVAPTIDTLGHVGADVRVLFTPAFGGGSQDGWLGISTGLSGSYVGGAGAAHVTLFPELALPVEPVVLRAGLGYSGRFLTADCPSVRQREVAGWQAPFVLFGLDAPLTKTQWTPGYYPPVVRLGPELSGEYLVSLDPCASANRGLFSLGLSVSLLFYLM